MRILGLIPARGGSKSVPKKNIKKLCGKPLIQYTIEAAQQSKKLSKVILSSDDESIITVAKLLDVEVPFVRPKHLAEDTSPTLGVIQHALRFYQEKQVYFDAVCLLQVTSPFKTGDFIDEAIEEFYKSGCDALVSVQKVPDEYNPHWTFKTTKHGNLELFTGEKTIISRRQDLPDIYHRDGLIYITKTHVLLEQNSLYGEKLTYIKSPSDYTINIDTEEDWKKAEAYLNSKNS
ncbi:acylneuraminate cytidylyltransferase family protein [Tamlana fucoidanivorans]|uniref:Acylneuraminate cytidylyltransferase family protein n=1 Tax=Allotamlana fucoidanivorans TaxID=2583814 RepID=A0A5C4SQM7_9FLAO|nr:acylneuraminate cytidylyltransferase family protein [Tamlana fucoidanivorans]TNJ45756.1 acylneuraminate cytidylyltransferase family protein [Tamlana fucoidanivorans]